MTIKELNTKIERTKGLMLYFGTLDCGICQDVKPKLLELRQEQFPKMDWMEIDPRVEKEVAAHCSVFAVPVLEVYWEGKLSFRKARVFSLAEVAQELSRPYALVFG